MIAGDSVRRSPSVVTINMTQVHHTTLASNYKNIYNVTTNILLNELNFVKTNLFSTSIVIKLLTQSFVPRGKTLFLLGFLRGEIRRE